MSNPDLKIDDCNIKHCDEYIMDKSQPKCLRLFLLINRIPAYWKYDKWIGKGKPEPVLFADYKSNRVRVVMASRFGDVGITHNLKAQNGYDIRVSVAELSNFSEVA